jgi:hypothetical protein
MEIKMDNRIEDVSSGDGGIGICIPIPNVIDDRFFPGVRNLMVKGQIFGLGTLFITEIPSLPRSVSGYSSTPNLIPLFLEQANVNAVFDRNYPEATAPGGIGQKFFLIGAGYEDGGALEFFDATAIGGAYFVYAGGYEGFNPAYVFAFEHGL